MEDFLISFRKQAALIKEQYPSFKMWDDGSAIMLYQGVQEHQLIKEFLYTVSPDKTVENISKRLNIPLDDFQINKSKNSEFIFIRIKGFSQDLLEKLITEMDIFGYFYAKKYSTEKSYSNLNNTPLEEIPQNILDNITFIIQFEPKYDIQIIPQPYIYHLTPDFNWKKIRTLGLTPKTQAKISEHPGRIYLVDNFNPKDFEELAITLWDENPDKDIIRDMDLLEIDTSKLKDHKFFEDPKFHFGENGTAVWTYENIPPFAIKHIKSILVNPRVKDRK